MKTVIDLLRGSKGGGGFIRQTLGRSSYSKAGASPHLSPPKYGGGRGGEPRGGKGGNQEETGQGEPGSHGHLYLAPAPPGVESLRGGRVLRVAPRLLQSLAAKARTWAPGHMLTLLGQEEGDAEGAQPPPP